MLMTAIVVLVVSGALILGAAWGLSGRLTEGAEGFIVAMAGGALIVSVMSELIEPAGRNSALWALLPIILTGAVAFVVADHLVARTAGEESGGGMLLTITFDGVPENLALGVALIGAGPGEVAALAGSIFLSNLPEAAGGAKSMCENGMGRAQALGLWAATAVLLSAAALIGNVALQGVADGALGLIRGFAAGAVAASLATEVFPKAFHKERRGAGIAVTLGLVIAYWLGQLGSG